MPTSCYILNIKKTSQSKLSIFFVIPAPYTLLLQVSVTIPVDYLNNNSNDDSIQEKFLFTVKGKNRDFNCEFA